MRFAAAAFVSLSVLVPGLAWGQPYAFVTGAADDAVGVVDLGHDTLVGRIPVPGLPSGLSYNADDGQLYVVRSQAGALERITTATGARITIPVGAEPSAVWAEPTFPRFVYVAQGSADRVSVVGSFGGPPRVLFSYPVGDKPLALTGGGGRLYVANFGDGTVTVIDTVNATLVGVVQVGRDPAALALDAAAGRLYVARLRDDRVAVVDTTTLTVTAQVPVCATPKGLALGGGRLYVACFDDGRVNVVDTAAASVVADGPSGAGNPVDLQLGPDGQRLYVAHFDVGKSLHVLDAATLAPLGAIEAPAGAIGLAGSSPSSPPALANWGRATPAVARPSLAAAAARAFDRLQGEPSHDWRVEDGDMLLFQVHSQSGSVVTTFSPDGGNPGGWRSVRFNGAGTAVLLSHWPAFTFDPATQGGILSVDASWDRRFQGKPGPMFDRLVLLQGGVVYRSNAQAVSGSAWQPTTFTGLTENGFTDGAGNRPDFSLGGGPIVFGYFAESTSPLTATHGIDNLRITIHRPPPADGHGVLDVRGSSSIAPNETQIVVARRRFGAAGAVSARVVIECPDGGGTAPETVSWGDGQQADRLLFIACPPIPADVNLRTGTLYLEDPTGGAQLDPNVHRILVVAPNSGPLAAIAATIGTLFAGVTPVWLAPLVPLSLWMALRRRRPSQRRGRNAPASAPASEP